MPRWHQLALVSYKILNQEQTLEMGSHSTNWGLTVFNAFKPSYGDHAQTPCTL